MAEVGGGAASHGTSPPQSSHKAPCRPEGWRRRGAPGVEERFRSRHWMFFLMDWVTCVSTAVSDRESAD